MYLVTAINLDDFFSYSGSTAVFGSLSFIAGGKIVHEIDMLQNRVYFTKYLRLMSKAESEVGIISKVSQATRVKSLAIIGISTVFYFAILISYAVSVLSRIEEDNKSIGWFNIFLLFVTDSTLVASGKFIL